MWPHIPGGLQWCFESTWRASLCILLARSMSPPCPCLPPVSPAGDLNKWLAAAHSVTGESWPPTRPVHGFVNGWRNLDVGHTGTSSLLRPGIFKPTHLLNVFATAKQGLGISQVFTDVHRAVRGLSRPVCTLGAGVGAPGRDPPGPCSQRSYAKRASCSQAF